VPTNEPRRKPATTFSATIKKVGINPCVDPPARVSKAFGIRGYVPVRGTLNGNNGKRFTQTLVPIGDGRHRLFVNGPMLKSATVAVGDRIEVSLTLNRSVRKEPMPGSLAKKMRASKSATATWESLTPSRQKEILRYLNSAKRPETLERNVDRTIAMLERRKVSAPLAAVRIPAQR
jgi:hypothetical protein